MIELVLFALLVVRRWRLEVCCCRFFLTLLGKRNAAFCHAVGSNTQQNVRIVSWHHAGDIIQNPHSVFFFFLFCVPVSFVCDGFHITCREVYVDELADELSYRQVMRKACCSLVQATSSRESTPNAQVTPPSPVGLYDYGHA